MESLAIIILGLAFYWLMLETRWLTIRLERTLERTLNIGGILMMGIGMVFLAVGLKINPLGLYRLHNYTEEDLENDMVRLWQFYGKRQPIKVIG